MRKKIRISSITLIAFFALIILVCVLMPLLLSCDITSIAGIGSSIQGVKSGIVGTSFTCEFYDNEGQKFMTVNGEKIDMTPNVVSEITYYEDGTKGYTKSLSSVMTVTIDGSEIESCGSTILFIEDGLTTDAVFSETGVDNINSTADGFSDNTMIANMVNGYKNFFGKPTVVVVQSQLGDPICAFSGNDVYWEVCQDLPKTTKLMIDGKALYIHRANFQIIDKDLLS